MNEHGKSDGSVVPSKRPNEAGQPAEEAVEGRDPANGNLNPQNTFRTPSREDVHSARERVRQAARQDKGRRFTALFHLIYAEAALREAHERLDPKASAGADGVTWKQYGDNLEVPGPLWAAETRSARQGLEVRAG